MPRVTRAPARKRRKRKLLKLAKGFRGRKNRAFRLAKEQVRKSLQRAYIDRRRKKREARGLAIVRLGAAAREIGFSYSRYIAALKKKDILLSRKILAELAVKDKDALKELVS